MKTDNCDKLVFHLYHKKNYLIHIRALKKELDQGLIAEIFHRVIKLSQESWLNPCIVMITEHRTEAKYFSKKVLRNFFKLMRN